MQIAVEGCCHGELDKIYETLGYLEKKEQTKIDLLICCGDFQVGLAQRVQGEPTRPCCKSPTQAPTHMAVVSPLSLCRLVQLVTEQTGLARQARKEDTHGNFHRLLSSSRRFHRPCGRWGPGRITLHACRGKLHAAACSFAAGCAQL